MPRRPLRRLLPLLALIVAAVAVELVLVPEAAWRQRLVGSNMLICLPMVPILSLAPLAAVLWMLRRAAPASPALAGAAAGLVAALSRRHPLRLPLLRRLAAVRRHLVLAGDARHGGGRRLSRTQAAAMVGLRHFVQSNTVEPV